MHEDVAESVRHDLDAVAVPVNVPEGRPVAVLDHHLRVECRATRTPHPVLEGLILSRYNNFFVYTELDCFW